MNFTAQFKAARSVSTPLICVRTPDPASTIRSLSVAAAELAKALNESEPAVLTHDVANGLNGRDEQIDNLPDALDAFARLLQDEDWAERSFQVYDHAGKPGGLRPVLTPNGATMRESVEHFYAATREDL